MNISLNWLTDYVDVSLPVKELGELLTRIGLNLEGVTETDTDIVLDLEVTSNRSDCLGHLGVARELAAATGVAFRPPTIGDLPTSGRAAELTSIEVQVPDLCPRYTARVLRNVKVGPSPNWLVERLDAVGLRSINNVVDVTNYVLMEYSQPLHSFDYDKLAENRIVVRRGKGGERMASIDETTCTLDESMLIIADAERPIAIAGVMGGLDTEVTEATTNVLIESAQFDPLSVRRTSRKLRLMSESNYRFERGVDPVGVDEASLRACQLILELAGGELAEGVVDAWAAPYEAPEVAMRPQRCIDLLGLDIPVDRQVDILDRLGLSPRPDGERIVCTIPPHRADLRREVDLIEEVGRIESFDSIPVSHKITHTVAPESLPQRVRQQLGQILSAAGFDEAVTFTFVDADEAALFGAEETVRADTAVRKTNNALRTSLLPSLLRACKTNQDAGNGPVSLWELASVFPPRGPGELPDEHLQIGLVTTGDLRELRGAVEAVVEDIAGERVDVMAGDVPGLADGAAAEIRLNGEAVGVVGPVTPKVMDHYGLEHTVAAATLRLDAILSRAGQTRTYTPVPRFPSMRRDLSLIVDEAVTWRELGETVDGVAQPMRVAVEYVTTYRGKPVPAGRKSVTIALEYRSEEGTLRSEQVDEQIAEIVTAMEAAFAAKLRA